MKYNLLAFALFIIFSATAQPKISFTFDDGFTGDMPGYTFDQWNSMLLGHLDNAGVKTILFSAGYNKTDEKGTRMLKSWDDNGHQIANHTFSHENYNTTSFEKFKNDFLKNDSIINGYKNYVRLFRFPYLKEGETEQKISQFREFLKEQGYHNGHVTVDASDWYVDSRLRMRLLTDPTADIKGFKEFYLGHLFERAVYYEKLSYKLAGRHINHTLLLHHNLAAALFLDDLIALFKEKGWQIISAPDAYQDKIFQQEPRNVPAGESLIWSLSKQSETATDPLRYPAEDMKYEKEKMDSLGL